MRDILEEIVAWKRKEVGQFKRLLPPVELYRRVEPLLGTPLPSMKVALQESSSGIIAEFKRRSPSKGWIKEDGRADVIPIEYQMNGASALSILTDEKYFGGSDDFVREACQSGVTIPILYKNFVVDEYQLFQARLCGATAVLLIAADLTIQTCRQLLSTAHELGLEVLLEIHSREELDYVALEPDVCGVNNRHLGSFVTSVDTSFLLAEELPGEVVKVSESGISSPQTVRQLRQAGFVGFLVGEYFMKAPSPGVALKEFISAI